MSPVEVPETPPVVPLTWPVVPLAVSLSTLPVLLVVLVMPVSLTAPVVGPLMLACESLIEPTLSLVAESETEPEPVVGPGPPLDSLAVLEPLALIPSLAEAPPSLPHAATSSGKDNMTTIIRSDISHDLSPINNP